jgi:hypothetical protein
MSFVVSGLALEAFRPLFDLDDAALAGRGAVRRVTQTGQRLPCRITLENAQPGERVLLLNYEHQSAPTPYRASHAIFVRETALQTSTLRDGLPPVMEGRVMSLRAFDADGMIVAADLAQPGETAAVVERQLADPRVAYVHAHFADYGCYAARFDRA